MDTPSTWDKVLVLPIFAKTATLMDSIEGIVERLNISGYYVYLYELIKLLSQAIFLCHLFGTLYFLLAQIEFY